MAVESSKRVKFGNGLFRQRPQRGREFNFPAAFAVRVKNRASRNDGVKHFLQTQRLGAKLGIVVFPLAAFADFEFDGKKRLVGPLLHDVTFAGQTEPVGKNRQRPQQLHALHHFVTPQIGVLMHNVAAQGVLVVLKNALDVD